MITIDCNGVENPRQMHALLASALSFPEYYGYNLDALFDCLTQWDGQGIQLKCFGNLGEWKKGFQRVFDIAMGENPNLQILVI